MARYIVWPGNTSDHIAFGQGPEGSEGALQGRELVQRLGAGLHRSAATAGAQGA